MLDHKKNLRAPAMPGDRPQLLAAAIVNLILTHSGFLRRKNLWIFVFKIWFEIFCRDINTCYTYTYDAINRKMGHKSVTAGRIITYRTKD